MLAMARSRCIGLPAGLASSCDIVFTIYHSDEGGCVTVLFAAQAVLDERSRAGFDRLGRDGCIGGYLLG